MVICPTDHLQVATFSSELGQYGEAIQIFEDVASRSVENNLLKYSAKGYLLSAGICHLCSKPNFCICCLIVILVPNNLHLTCSGMCRLCMIMDRAHS